MGLQTAQYAVNGRNTTPIQRFWHKVSGSLILEHRPKNTQIPDEYRAMEWQVSD